MATTPGISIIGTTSNTKPTTNKPMAKLSGSKQAAFHVMKLSNGMSAFPPLQVLEALPAQAFRQSPYLLK